MSREVFLVCHRSFANVVKLTVRDSTGHDNSRASKTWHGVHILVGSPKILLSLAIPQVQKLAHYNFEILMSFSKVKNPG